MVGRLGMRDVRRGVRVCVCKYVLRWNETKASLVERQQHQRTEYSQNTDQPAETVGTLNKCMREISHYYVSLLQMCGMELCEKLFLQTMQEDVRQRFSLFRMELEFSSNVSLICSSHSLSFSLSVLSIICYLLLHLYSKQHNIT